MNDDVEELKAQIRHHLATDNITSAIKENYKSPYRLYERSKQNLRPQMLDIHVITESTRECYTALGIIHEMFTPLKGSSIKDFISIPRSNGYQALHTTILFRENSYSIQIRTQAMDLVARYGILAKVDGRSIAEYEPWLNLLKDLASDEPNSKDFFEGIQAAAEADRIYVCTPKGDYWSFPRNAIVLDFAYRIHTEIGHNSRACDNR